MNKVSDNGTLFKKLEMKIKTAILVLFAGVFFLSACQKDTDMFVADAGQLNGADTSWHTSITAAMPVSILKNNLLPEIYVDSFEVNANIATILTSTGLQVTFPPNCCVNGTGQPISGRVQAELMLVKEKGDMIRLNVPTTTDDSLLVAAGDIFIRLTKNGQQLQLAPGVRINIRYSDMPTNQSMKFFAGDGSNALHFNWLPNPDLNNNIVIAGTQAYEIYTNRLNWISVAYVYDVNSASIVNLSAELAAYFTNANTIAFAVLKDFRSVAALHGEVSIRKFISPKLPIGKAVTVVVISKQGNDYYLGHEATVTAAPTAGSGNQSVQLTPVKKPLSEILAYLSSL